MICCNCEKINRDRPNKNAEEYFCSYCVQNNLAKGVPHIPWADKKIVIKNKKRRIPC